MMKIFWILVSIGAVVWFVFWLNSSEKAPEVPLDVETSQETEAKVEDSNTKIDAEKKTQPVTSNKKIINGMTIETIKEGSGPGIINGQIAVVDYTGTLTNGTVFDSSIPRGQTFEFPLGAGMVIAGWEQGVLGMKVGEVRKLTIPPELGYGERGAGAIIPPNATLIFEVTLRGIK